MDETAFDSMIIKMKVFAKEIFSPDDVRDKFKIKLMETLDQMMEMGKHSNTKRLQMVENLNFKPHKKIKIDQTLFGKFQCCQLLLLHKIHCI